MVSPVPLNVEQMGGNGRVMMVGAEIEGMAREVGTGLGCPIEMVWGGLNWSGASVSLRVLENHFINDRENLQRMFDFLMPKLATYYRLPRVRLRLSEFKMADDVQQMANAVNLMVQGFLSRDTVLGEMGWDGKHEFDKLEREHTRLNAITMKDNVQASHMNTVIQAMEAKAQVLLQYELQLEQQKIQSQMERQRLEDLAVYVQQVHAAGYATPLEFDQSSQMLSRLPPEYQQGILSTWGQTMPLVTQLLMQKAGIDQQNMAISGQAMSNVQGAQSAGAAEGAGLDDGAEGPYSDGAPPPAGGPAASDRGNAGQTQAGLPEQRPPRGASAGI
jgi:hypothetical protein